MAVEKDGTDGLELFNRFFADYQARFLSFAESYTRDRAAAEDIVMESFMKYWENRLDLPEGSNIQGYVLTVIKNKCLNYLERLRVRKDFAERLKEHAAWELNLRISTLQACEPDGIFESNIRSIVDKTLRSFPEQTRRIFKMSRYERRSHKEIAEKLHVTTKTVEYHITKALKKLRENLKDYVIAIALAIVLLL